MKLGMCIMTLEPVSAAYFINPSPKSVSVCVSPLANGSKNFTATTNTRSNRRIVGVAVLYAVRILSKESRRFMPELPVIVAAFRSNLFYVPPYFVHPYCIHTHFRSVQTSFPLIVKFFWWFKGARNTSPDKGLDSKMKLLGCMLPRGLRCCPFVPAVRSV
jgi:hypothetical protein